MSVVTARRNSSSGPDDPRPARAGPAAAPWREETAARFRPCCGQFLSCISPLAFRRGAPAAVNGIIPPGSFKRWPECSRIYYRRLDPRGSSGSEDQAMADYENLIILDGAIGTELQAMGVPMHPASGCSPGNYTHPATVRQMHERYIRAGAPRAGGVRVQRPGEGDKHAGRGRGAGGQGPGRRRPARVHRRLHLVPDPHPRPQDRNIPRRHRLRVWRQHLDGGAEGLRRRAGGDPGRVRGGLRAGGRSTIP